MDVYVGIDGSGVGDDARYAQVFRNSFVNRIGREQSWDIAQYFRGPTADGRMTRQISREAIAFLEKGLHGTRTQTPRLFLAGYSRGGAAAIRVARELGAHGHSVHALLLFDAVDMTHTVEAALIPRNVRYCFHARRHPNAASRSFWGNCGTRPESNDREVTLYQDQFFRCTHGGMGGTPFPRGEGEALDDVINESLLDQDQTNFVRRMPFNVGSVPVIVGHEVHRAASRTAITFRQDAEISRRVGEVMFAMLASARRAPAARPATNRRPALVG